VSKGVDAGKKIDVIYLDFVKVFDKTLINDLFKLAKY